MVSNLDGNLFIHGPLLSPILLKQSESGKIGKIPVMCLRDSQTNFLDNHSISPFQLAYYKLHVKKDTLKLQLNQAKEFMEIKL